MSDEPPPPAENPEYIQCPHCERRFKPATAERHIPKCKDIKAKPSRLKKKRWEHWEQEYFLQYCCKVLSILIISKLQDQVSDSLDRHYLHFLAKHLFLKNARGEKNNKYWLI